ncbi:carbohydrate esterase family 3 protein [Lentithecium fluviatile CBS 122367]|uniref:Carbohydrate esterase family 3 protein n=1 Tax=Lentithecium fluviatile CBS 122367 TaxID=1168545 RepID=A0A6G1JD80_9PLEO|nr:carbohydrate esterase family 3 protein [Lentithecium fluviatile CBS 122367]
MYNPRNLITDLNLISLALPTTAHPRPTRIMHLGASIVTESCWRAYVWQALHSFGITNIDFVGSNSGPATCTLSGTTVPYDSSHEGHSGSKVTGYAGHGNVIPWLEAAEPDVVLMHVGTNDASALVSVEDFLSAYDTLLAEMRAQNEGMRIVVSKLIPIDVEKFGQEIADRIVEYNDALEWWVEENWTECSPVLLVDVYEGYEVEGMTRDGKHPNEAGDVFMAGKFSGALLDVLVM